MAQKIFEKFIFENVDKGMFLKYLRGE